MNEKFTNTTGNNENAPLADDAVPLDGTNSARLINMRRQSKRTDELPEAHPRSAWYELLHSNARNLHQLESEQKIMSWYMKGFCDSSPEWCKSEQNKNPDHDSLKQAFSQGTMPHLSGYQASADSILEKVDASWKQGTEAPKGRIRVTSEKYWSDESHKAEHKHSQGT